MKKNTAASICEGAVVVALTVILSLAGMYVPVLGLFAAMLSGIPLMWLIIRRGMYISFAALIASMALIFALTGNFISGPLNCLLSLLPYMTTGFCIKKNYKYYTTLAAVAVADLFGYLVMIVVTNQTTGENSVLKMIDDYFAAIKNLMGTYVTGEGTEGLSDMLTSSFETIKNTLLSYFPSILIIVSLAGGYVILSLGIFFAKRLRISNYNYVPFRMIRLPKSMLIIALVLMLLSFFASDTSSYGLALKNLVAVVSFVLAIGGLSVVDYKLSKRIQSGYKRFLIYLLVMVLGYIFISLIFYALLLVGMIDSNIDLRKAGRDGDSGER